MNPESPFSDEQLKALQLAYGKKFTAISSALGYACSAQGLLSQGDDDGAGRAIERVISILVDA